MDDLDSSQFDSLVKLMSLPRGAQDFRYLLMPTKLREVFDHLEEFVLPKVLHLNFEGPRGA